MHDKRQSLQEAHTWLLCIFAHTALHIRQFLAEETFQLWNTPIFPNLAPHDFFLLPKVKSVLKKTHFSDIDSIKMAVMMKLKKIPKNAFEEYFELWKRRMHKCFQTERDYFERI